MIKFFDGTSGDSFDREIKFRDMLVASGKAAESLRCITKLVDRVEDGKEVEIFGNRGRAIAYEKADRSFADWCNFTARNNTDTTKNAMFANQVSNGPQPILSTFINSTLLNYFTVTVTLHRLSPLHQLITCMFCLCNSLRVP